VPNKVEWSKGIVPPGNSNFQNLGNAILGILAELLHYCGSQKITIIILFSAGALF